MNGDPVAVLRLSGEVSTKASATRRLFVTRLIRNAKDALRASGHPATVERTYERLFVPLRDPAAAVALSHVFGVQSVGIGTREPAESLEAVVARGAALFGEAVRGKRFAVRARIVGERRDAPFGRRDLERALGAVLDERAAGVDLEHPEFTARIEVHQGRAYYFVDNLPAPAGLPLGSEGSALALVSGGFDSAVAAWYMLRRGVRLDYLFCNLGGRSHELGTLRVMKVLADGWSYGQRPKLHMLDFAPVVGAIQEHAAPRYWQILLKREMLRAAERVALERGAEAIVTGEAVGQVSSQTLTNLATISQVTNLPIFRPLLGFNKDEIIARARAIGTEPLSAVVDEYCAITPRRPATAARVDEVLAQEAKRSDAPLEAALEVREVLDLRATDPEARVYPEIATDRVPEGALVVDLRSRAQFASWHREDSVHLDWSEALEAFPSFSKDKSYLLVCEFGLKSAHLAELMRAEGSGCGTTGAAHPPCGSCASGFDPAGSMRCGAQRARPSRSTLEADLADQARRFTEGLRRSASHLEAAGASGRDTPPWAERRCIARPGADWAGAHTAEPWRSPSDPAAP